MYYFADKTHKRHYNEGPTSMKIYCRSDKELNCEFFQRIERRVSIELEVVVNGNLQNEEEPVVNDNDAVEKSKSEGSYKQDE